MTVALGSNLLAWMAQTSLLAAAGALLPPLLRVRHPRTHLAYCHAVLGFCLLLPMLEPWSHPPLSVPAGGVAETAPASVSGPAGIPVAGNARPKLSLQIAPPRAPATSTPSLHGTAWTRWTDARVLLGILCAGALARICWLLLGLWKIRRYRILATPLYPVPESVRAASAITHADALLCISSEIAGPVMLGWLTPVVLLPECFLALEEEAQCAIACHEMLHVKRADWVVTLLEELLGALLWFNPGAWMLLAQTRLAREELVDAETVRLTSAREPYIEALLAIARGGQTLDLAPAPLFLKRRHLTQRMHSLLKDASVSKGRLLVSYTFSSAILACAGWFACVSFPLTGQPRLTLAAAGSQRPRIAVESALAAPPVASQDQATPSGRDRQTIVAFQLDQGRGVRLDSATATAGLSSAPVPPDPQEPVTGAVQVASGPAARAAALYLLERAKENGLTHRAGTPPYRLVAAFSAGGPAAYVGSGQLTETWLSGQRWRWTAMLGSYSVIRLPGAGVASSERFPGVVPMRVHMLRNAIFWAIRQISSNAQIRTASIQWNGKPATCVLVSGIVAPIEQTRLWEEEEYCVDSASGALQMLSMSPGVYTVYGYSQNLQFHGRSTPDRITVYTHRAIVLDAQMSLADAAAVDESELAPTQEMIAAGRVGGMDTWGRFPMNVPSYAVSGIVKPVMVHASVSGRGEVVEEELLTASDPALAQTALDLVKNAKFQAAGNQRQMYINVKFIPMQ